MRSALLLTSVLALAACNVSGHARDNGDADEGPAGPTIKRDYRARRLRADPLAGSHDVIVTVGPAAAVSAEGDQRTLDRLEIKVENGELRIGSKKRNGWFNSDNNRGRGVTIRVTVPKLAAASIAGSGDMRIDKVEGDRFGGRYRADPATWTSQRCEVGAADFSIAGSGGVTARGSADSSSVSIAGSGDVDTAGLTAQHGQDLGDGIGQCQRQRQRERGRVGHGLGRCGDERRRQVHGPQDGLGRRTLR